MWFDNLTDEEIPAALERKVWKKSRLNAAAKRAARSKAKEIDPHVIAAKARELKDKMDGWGRSMSFTEAVLTVQKQA